MASGVTDTDKGYKATLAALRRMAGSKHVVIGVRSGPGGQKPPGSSLNLAEIASVNEFGSADGRVPERSFLRSTVDKNKTAYAGMAVAAVARAAEPGGDIERELDLIGLRIASDVKQAIANGIGPANAESTKARKGSDKPLVDQGRLRAAIDHEVRDGK